MDPRPPRHDGSSPKRARPSADGAVLEAPAIAVESRPDEIPINLELSLALLQPYAPAAASQEKLTGVVGGASATVGGSSHQEEGAAAAEAVAKIQTTQAVNDRFAPIVSDVKSMLLTGRLEGQKIIYKTKRSKLNLLHGVIHGSSYFCSCGDCDQKGKALSARAFEQHALKNGKVTNNPSDHIVLASSNISLLKACRKLKEARNAAMFEATFNIIMKTDHEAVPKPNAEASTSADDDSSRSGIVRDLLLFREEMDRYQKSFQDLSKSFDELADDK